MESLKKKILEKKELRGIPLEFLDEFLAEYEKKHKKEFDILKNKNFNEKSKEFDELKKFIRKKLRELHGVFAKNTIGLEKKEKLLEKLKKAHLSNNELEKKTILKLILRSHQSTFERYNSYDEVYKTLLGDKLQQKKINKIIDLGCGYNPFSYEFLKCAPQYFAIDINTEDTKFINDYFSLANISGKALTLDLTQIENLKKLNEISKKSDVCFLFKLLDSLESKKRGTSKELLNHLNSKVLIISFPLKTIGGKKEIKGERKWFLRLLENYNFDYFEISNEKYYVLKQKNSL